MTDIIKDHIGPLPLQILPPLPEVYQIEVASTCNFQCPMCPAQFFPRSDTTPFISMNLVDKIIRQGDLDASYFVEFQHSGEPLLHPELHKIIKKVKETGVMTGLSTNGVYIQEQMKALLELDIITVSIDSIEQHGELRKSKGEATPVDKLIHDIKDLLTRAADNDIAVDLQIIEIGDWENARDQIANEFSGYKCNIRTQPNCYVAFMQNGISLPVSQDLCINPWFSVTIMCNGNVGCCCNSQGDDVIYGNLNDQTLREVWAGDEVKKMREEIQTRQYRDVCAKCYMRSPALYHWNMYQSEIKRKYKNSAVV